MSEKESLEPSAKPTKVEVGQRWQYGGNANYTVVRKERGMWRLRWEDNGEESGALHDDASTLADTFLGWAPGYGPTAAPLSPPSVMVGQRREWTGDAKRNGPFVVEKSAMQGYEYRCVYENSAGSWDCNAPELLRESTLLSQPEALAGKNIGPGPSAVPRCTRCNGIHRSSECPPGWSKTSSVSTPRYGIFSGMEYCNINGLPMSALHFIQARKKPEPYIPSVDDWDLLPDAGR